MLSTVDSSSLVYSLDRAFLFAFVNRFIDVQSSLISYFLLLASHFRALFCIMDVTDIFVVLIWCISSTEKHWTCGDNSFVYSVYWHDKHAGENAHKRITNRRDSKG